MRYAFILAGFVMAAALAGCPSNGGPEFTSANVAGGGRGGDELGGMPTDDAEGGEGEGGGGGDPREVVEPDVIRRAGNLLYVLNQFRGLTVVDLSANEVVAQVPTYGYPRDLYIDGDRAYVLVGYASNYEVGDDGLIGVTIDSRLYVVDTSIPAEASIAGTFAMQGDLVDSRLVGDVIYAVGADYYWYAEGDGVVRKQTSSTWVTSIDIANPAAIAQADQVDFPGVGQVIHVTPEAVFVATTDYVSGNTRIAHVDISDPAGAMTIATESISVRGYVADKFKMDAFEGVLRVVSSAWDGERNVYVTTVDLATLEQAELRLDSATGDTLFATRFDGNRGYIVTYFMVDPLYVIDFSDPMAPAILSELEVPGFSTHIEPRGDRLITLGVDDSDGGRRVSVSLFDVSAAQAVPLATASFGDEWSWSTAYGDVKALTVLDDVIIVPFSGWTSEFGGYERLQFISYTGDTLEPRGYVDLSGTILRSFEYDGSYYGVTTEQLARIDGVDLDAPAVESTLTLAEYVADFAEVSPDTGIEVVSRFGDGTTVVRVVDGAQEPVSEVTVDVGNFQSMIVEGNIAAIIGTVWDETGASYRVAGVDVSTPGAPEVLYTTAVPVQPYYYYYYYDFGGAGGPEDATGGGGGVSSGGTDAVAGAGIDKDVWGYPYYWNYDAGALAFDLDGTIGLRCTAATFDPVYGEDTAYQGIALVDVETGEHTATAGLGYSHMDSVDVSGGKLYIGTAVPVDVEGGVPNAVAHYVRELDIARGSEGPAANVPGSFVQYDAGNDLLVLRDYQWDLFYNVTSSVTTVDWDGGDSAALLDTQELPQYVWELVGGGNALYFGGYSTQYDVTQIAIGDDGALGLGEPVAVSQSWVRLLGARGAELYLGVGGGAIARYGFDEDGQGLLGPLVETMGMPLSLRFGDDRAYAPMGYFGLVTLE